MVRRGGRRRIEVWVVWDTRRRVDFAGKIIPGPTDSSHRALGKVGFQSRLGIRKECTLCRVERDGLAVGFAVVIRARCRRTRVLSIGILVTLQLKSSVALKVSE